jgi:hypothetical protein
VKPKVDLIVLARDAGPLHPEVKLGIRLQQEVQIAVHRVEGKQLPSDQCRWDAIARARNEGKLRGKAPWLMFLDDDVVLAPECVSRLVTEIRRRPAYGALGADYLGQARAGRVSPHVSMGATVFRREVLDQIRFRWDRQRCECQCCCDDLRRLLWGVDYSPVAQARHLAKNGAAASQSSKKATNTSSRATKATGVVLAALNGRHLGKFQHQFLSSLRWSGNNEAVIALAMGLNEHERQALLSHPRVKAFFRSDSGRFVGRQRLKAFQEILSGLAPETLVAYWDAGDVIFQAKLEPLWRLLEQSPGKVLAVREPSGYPDNPAVAHWTESIRDPDARSRARNLLYDRPFLNAGFMAGTARSLLKYCRIVAGWYQSDKLVGTSNPGDQMALNIYCHSQPEVWKEAPEGWNYCLCRRKRETFYRDKNGRFVDLRGRPIYVVHGNAHTLRRFERSPQ